MSVDPRALADTLLARGQVAAPGDPGSLRATVRAPTRAAGGYPLPSLPGVFSTDGVEGDLVPEARLGQGGMGEVWLARQASLQRPVALKVPRSDDGGLAAALVSEARVSGGLDHPHVVPVHALGTDARGRPVLVMKRVQGCTLEALAQSGAHPIWEGLRQRHGDRETAIIEILLRVADALSFAHARGVVHRDVKPENVMVGEFGEAYLMDWGCAHELRLGPAEGFVGSPAFMAPEQVDPSLGPVDARADVYLLGATLHAALTGRPRHEGETLAAVLAAAVASRPVDYGETLPPELAAVCNRATAPALSARFQSIAHLQDELRRALRLRATRGLAARIAAAAGPALEAAPLEPTARQRLLQEARYGLAPLVKEWPEHQPFRDLEARVLAALVEAAVTQRAMAEAEEALAALPAPPAALTARVAGLRAEFAEARRLARVGEAELRERDLRPGRRGFAALTAVILLNSALMVAFLSADEAPGMAEVVKVDLAALGLVAAAAVALRRRIVANRRGRSTTAAVFLVTVSLTLCDALSAALGHTLVQAAPFGLLTAAVGFAAIAALLELPRAGRAAAGACAAVFCAEAFLSVRQPDWAGALFSFSMWQSFMTAAFLFYVTSRDDPAALRRT